MMTALLRISKFLSKSQRGVLVNFFSCSHFGYYNLAWIFFGKYANGKFEKWAVSGFFLVGGPPHGLITVVSLPTKSKNCPPHLC